MFFFLFFFLGVGEFGDFWRAGDVDGWGVWIV